MWKPKVGEWVKGSVVDFEPSGAQHKVHASPLALQAHALWWLPCLPSGVAR